MTLLPMRSTYFFLDFDGVVCDSVPECFLSSHLAYHEFLLGESVESVSLREKCLFYKYRPFIRSGEDYLLLHDMIRREVAVTSQEVFDRELDAAGPEVMEKYAGLFYTAREKVLASDRQFWLDLNPLFPGMKEILFAVAANPGFYILSTKKPPFILEILGHYGIAWDERRVLFPGPRTKRQVIESVLPDGGGGGSAVFVDDQLDHLLTAGKNPAVRCRLADWGYVKEEWLAQKEVPVIGLGDMEDLTREFFIQDSPSVRPHREETGTPQRK